MKPSDITDMGAVELSAAIHAKRVTCEAVMAAYRSRIDAINPRHNALVALRDPEVCLSEARACDTELAQGHSRGWMHGIPQAIKDTANAKGLPSTLGCTLLRHNIAASDSIIVERVKRAGALVIGKTNIPEFGLGSHTFNNVYGTTGNAYEPSLVAGGSSGGAAVALAQRMLPVADGSDFMGSLRNPAAWNNVFGMRPSQGLVPFAPGPDVWLSQLGTEGPMARRVEDLAALLHTQAGYDPRQPLSWSAAALSPLTPSSLEGLRVGWLGDLGGYLASESGVLAACEQGLERMRQGGAQVQSVTLDMDLETVWQAWLVWRNALIGPRIGALMHLPGARDSIKPEAIWEYEQAQGLSLTQFMRAAEVRTQLYNRLSVLLQQVDVLALPVAQVWPFPVEQRWPQTIGDRTMSTYHRWMEATIYATLAGLPAISVPSGFDPERGVPMGLQWIGPPRGDAQLLRWASAYEDQIPDWLAQRPH